MLLQTRASLAGRSWSSDAGARARAQPSGARANRAHVDASPTDAQRYQHLSHVVCERATRVIAGSDRRSQWRCALLLSLAAAAIDASHRACGSICLPSCVCVRVRLLCGHSGERKHCNKSSNRRAQQKHKAADRQSSSCGHRRLQLTDSRARALTGREPIGNGR